MTPQGLGLARRRATDRRAAAAPRQEACLRYAMGKYFDDIADFEHAFDNFRRANELTKCTRPAHQPEAMTRIVDRIIDAEDGEWLRRTRTTPTGSPTGPPSGSERPCS